MIRSAYRGSTDADSFSTSDFHELRRRGATSRRRTLIRKRDLAIESDARIPMSGSAHVCANQVSATDVMKRHPDCEKRLDAVVKSISACYGNHRFGLACQEVCARSSGYANRFEILRRSMAVRPSSHRFTTECRFFLRASQGFTCFAYDAPR